MRRRSGAGGKATKAGRHKTATSKRRHEPKAMRRRSSSASSLNKKVAQLTRELDEAHQQQAATADVLKVMSRSTFDLQSVLDILAESAARLCEADLANIWRPHGSVYRLAAAHQPFKSSAKDYLKNLSIEPSRGTCVGRTLLEGRIVHIHDILDDPDYALATSKLEGVRTMLGVPLLRDGTPIGVIALARSTRRPFTTQQIELATTFAAQAVIAIENARLLNELRRWRSESLQQQTATADVLKVISRSTFDLQVVLDTLVESAARLCRAEKSAIRLVKGDLYHNVANYGFSPEHRARMERAVTGEPGSLAGRVAITGKSVHLIDAQADSDPGVASRSRSGNVRTMLGVPLLREGTPIGALLLQRGVVRPFTDKEISLAEIFADQAVIAIENVRLFEAEQQRTAELAKSLEQQTATAEVLGVISSSSGDLQPVFSALLENATRICDANFGNMFLCENDGFRPVAMHNAPEAYLKARERGGLIRRPPDEIGLGSVMATKQAAQVADLTALPAFLRGDPFIVAGVTLAGIRTLLAVPMLKDDRLLGAIVIYRQEVRPFTEKQIALLMNFAAQAVIAIENTRLLNELRQRTDDLTKSLKQQTATSEVLRVISVSPGDMKPVFEAILANALRICEAKFGHVLLYDGERYNAAHLHDVPPSYGQFWEQNGPIRPSRPDTGLARLRAQYKSHIFSILRPIPPTLNEIHCALPQLIWRWLGRFLPCRWSRKIS